MSNRAMFFTADAQRFAEDIAVYLIENEVENVVGFLAEIEVSVRETLQQEP